MIILMILVMMMTTAFGDLCDGVGVLLTCKSQDRGCCGDRLAKLKEERVERLFSLTFFSSQELKQEGSGTWKSTGVLW